MKHGEAALLWAALHMALVLPASAFEGSVRPVNPSVDDEIVVLINGSIGGGDNITDTSCSVLGNDVVVRIAVEMCTGICPMSIMPVAIRIPLGRLAQGDYRLLVHKHQIDTVRADTTIFSDTTRFTVSASGVYPRIVALFWRQLDDDVDSTGYHFINGDTLSVVGVIYENCCAHPAAEMIHWSDSLMEISLSDTSMNFCDCADGPILVTVAIAGGGWSHVRLLHDRWGGLQRRIVHEFHVDVHAPGLCINLSDSTRPGVTLFVDSLWKRYEITSTLIGSPSVIRLSPNRVFSSQLTDELYVDDIAYQSDVLEDFQSFSPDDWSIVRVRDGSGLSLHEYYQDENRYLGIHYGNAMGIGCSNWAWRVSGYGGAAADTGRIRLLASLKNPGGSLHARTVTRGMAAPDVSMVLSGRILTVSGLPRSNRFTLRLGDAAGRTVLLHRSDSPCESIVIDLEARGVAPGVYFGSVESAGTRSLVRTVLH